MSTKPNNKNRNNYNFNNNNFGNNNKNLSNNNKNNSKNNNKNNAAGNAVNKPVNYLSGSMMIAIGAIVIIILIAIYLFKEFKKIRDAKKKDAEAKAEPADCPDYWELVNGKCRNLHGIGKCGKENDIDFSDPIFTNPSTGHYMKCRWAKDCGTQWEHISKLC